MPDNIFPYRKFKTVWQDYYKWWEYFLTIIKHDYGVDRLANYW
jgi:hypothetical protein